MLHQEASVRFEMSLNVNLLTRNYIDRCAKKRDRQRDTRIERATALRAIGLFVN
jgi:hypothetical protein